MRRLAWIGAALVIAGCGGGGSSGSSEGSTSDGGTSDGGSGSDGGTSTDGGAGGDASDAQAGDAGPTWAGQTSGDPLLVSMQLSVNDDPATPATYVQVGAYDTATSKQLDGATVTLTPQGGQPLTLNGGNGLPYQGSFALGWMASYTLSVTHAAGSRTGIVLTAPQKFTTSYNPQPKVGTPSTVTWTPSGESDVGVYVLFGNYGTPTASPLPDNGSFQVPATAFPSGGPAKVQLEVQRERTLSVPQQLSAQLIVTVYTTQIAVQP